MVATLVILLRISLFLALASASAWAGSYLDSAHGSATIGVKNINYPLYRQGNCGHCHQQHTTSKSPLVLNENPFALFAPFFNTSKTTGNYEQQDDFCFYCHGETSVQDGGITNYDYARTFGGYATGGPTTILEAFQQNSFHNLYDLWNLAKTQFSDFFTSQSNPCVACHNPHLVKRIKANPNNPGPYTVVSLPSDHGNLWGDDASERMDEFYPNRYQAPLYYSSTSTYEPGGTSTWDGSVLPDYATFCTQCHNASLTVYSSTLSRNLIKIEWVEQGGERGPGDKHGKNDAVDDNGTGVPVNLKAPYNSSSLGISSGFVTSCTDCHEPHGSPNPYLIRREVNGTLVSIDLSQKNGLGWLCRACHRDDHDFDPDNWDPNSWHHVHHGAGPTVNDPPYPNPTKCGWCHGGPPGSNPVPCLNCHMHGKDDSWLNDVYPSFYTGRRCF